MNQVKSTFAAPGWLWLGSILVLATVAAYWPVFSAGFIWDDDAYVTENPLLTAPDGWFRIWFSAHSQSQYFPLVYTTLRMEYAMWGLNPLGYHVVNLVLHVGNALLIWKLLRWLAVPGAWLAAAVFALHPVQVETVAWVTELKNTESTLFYLLAIFAWWKFCAGRGPWLYLLALGLHALALFAKTTACTLPAAMLLVLWIRREPVGWRRAAQTLPFLFLGFGMGLLSVWWEGHLGNYAPKYHLLGGPLDRLLIATHALWFYAAKVLWPVNLTFSYPRWAINPAELSQYVWLAGCLVVAAVLWACRRAWDRSIAAALFFFAAALSPMLGFIPLYTFYYSYVADHYQNFACLGIIGLVAGQAAVSATKSPGFRRIQVPLVAALLVGLGVLTWRQCGIYRNLETLWTDTLAKNPQSWMAHVNLGRLLAQRGEFGQAEAHYVAAIAINSSDESIYYNYANLLARSGRLDAAVDEYRRALALSPEKAEAHNNLGFALNKLHRTDEAISEYERAIACQPDYADAYYNLGNALSARHQMAAAVAAYQQAVRLNPNSELFRKRLQAVTATAQ
ncbi:MAG TPA: tetratricopeptide repeat protein [Candidatus Acidoferrales bacterium]|nr:tetratricopeptide repeat protein [Candidatus Acidoferrales bacterium]